MRERERETKMTDMERKKKERMRGMRREMEKSKGKERGNRKGRESAQPPTPKKQKFQVLAAAGRGERTQPLIRHSLM